MIESKIKNFSVKVYFQIYNGFGVFLISG